MKHLVIGCKGQIGSRHYRLLQEAGEEVYGLDINDLPYWDIDMVWICSPQGHKDNYVYQAIHKNKKVFVEKPYASLLKGGIWVACNYRFHPAVKVLKDNLHKVGDILYSRMHFSHYLPNQRKNWKEYMKDTNIVLDVGWHFVDLALWLFGKTDKYLRFNYECEFGFTDKAQIILRELNTFIDIDYLRCDKSWGIEVIGKKGTLRLSSIDKNPEMCIVQLIEVGMTHTLFSRHVETDEMYKNQLNYLLKNEWQSNIDQAMEVMKICG